MTYILYMLPEDPGLTGTRGEVTIRSTLVLGSFVVTIFAVIFLFYTSSFLTKRRRRSSACSTCWAWRKSIWRR